MKFIRKVARLRSVHVSVNTGQLQSVYTVQWRSRFTSLFSCVRKDKWKKEQRAQARFWTLPCSIDVYITAES